MRFTAALLVLGLSLDVHARPGDISDLIKHLTGNDARNRAAAARVVANRAASGDQIAISMARGFAVTDDLDVRRPIVDALSSASVIAPETRAHIPRAAVLERALRMWLPSEPTERFPVGRRCAVVGWVPRGVKLECSATFCSGFLHVERAYRITTGVRWSVTFVDRSRPDHARCAYRRGASR